MILEPMTVASTKTVPTNSAINLLNIESLHTEVSFLRINGWMSVV